MDRTMMLGVRHIGDDHPTYVIAEIGINHNGRVDLAEDMVRRAADVGADAVKFQLVDAERDYASGTESHRLFRSVALPASAWERIVQVADTVHVPIFASFAMPEDVEVALRLGFPAIKISSGNLTNLPLLRAAARSRLPIVASTGMSTLEEVEWAIRTITQAGCDQLAILHCTSRYPLPPEDANLRAIATLREAFPYPIGYSDHSVGTTCAIAAVALGARIIEKHVTPDRSLPGPDHHFSATFEELASLIQEIRATEAALGSREKAPVAAEIPLRERYRRTLVAARDLPAGTMLTPEAIVPKRAVTPGMDARAYDAVIGRQLARALAKNAPLTEDVMVTSP